MTIDSGRHPLANKDLDQVFKALSHPTRRRIIESFPAERPCDVAAIRTEVFDVADSDQIEVNLFHVHLPFLDDADVLDWDRDANTVTVGDRYDTTRQILRRLETPEGAV